jgi:phasin family protein
MIGNEQFSAWSKANVDGALDFARLSLHTTERLVALNLEANRAALADVAKSTQGFEVKDLQDVGALRNRVAEAGWNKMSAYSKATYDVLARRHRTVYRVDEVGLGRLRQRLRYGRQSRPPVR